MRRLFIKRDELIPVDSFNLTQGSKYTTVDYGKTGTKSFDSVLFEVRSLKTGKASRLVRGWVVEIENVSGLYFLLYTDKKIRSFETLVSDRRRVNAVPVGRLKYNNFLVYSIS